MTSRFRHETEFAARPDQVLAVLLDPAAHAARYAAAGATGAEVVDVDLGADGTLTFVSRRAESGSLPGPVARLVRGAAQLTQTERWGPVGPDGSRTAVWEVATKGVPVDIGGTTEVRPGGAGTRLVEAGTVTARVPLLSGVIEKVAAEQSAGKLGLEWAWLAEHL
ncbi:DUF2505 domain-containing protein [uncultured Jatrophihabitans sp.]|uniref:DUF2505 domain-containing protein n=1 Tax=uncultured Jatrophihabitans sp. TaxID=1610747 RepID=UPI0035CA0F0F